jgi:hypothetical protein
MSLQGNQVLVPKRCSQLASLEKTEAPKQAQDRRKRRNSLSARKKGRLQATGLNPLIGAGKVRYLRAVPGQRVEKCKAKSEKRNTGAKFDDLESIVGGQAALLLLDKKKPPRLRKGCFIRTLTVFCL